MEGREVLLSLSQNNQALITANLTDLWKQVFLQACEEISFRGKQTILIFFDSTEIGYEVVRVETTDADSLQDNKLSEYSIVPGPDSSKFSIESVNNVGIIKLKKVCVVVYSI